MSEYWKSLPRKFCDICKCWFADNKASIEFHERGKRHQENAQKRIQDIQKKGMKDFKKQKQLEDDMAKIERAALAAYKKDLQNAAVVLNSEFPISNEEQNDTQELEKKKPAPKKIKKEIDTKPPVIKKEPQEVISKVWYEAMSEDGYKYYWNTENSESRWEPPEEGYVSLEEQQIGANGQTTTEKTLTEDMSSKIKQEKKDDCEMPPCSIGPQPKIDPYGQWITIEKKEPEEIDLQLPKLSENIVEIILPVLKDEPKLKIKEKVISHLLDTDPTEEVTFKKRKFIGSSKRNARQRTDDD